MGKINDMRAQRAKAWEQAKAFLDAKRNDKGILGAEDTATYERMEKEIVDLGREIERQERIEAFERELNAHVGSPITSRPENAPKAQMKAGRASQEYRSAFWNHMRRQGNEFEVKNALQVGTDTEGGYLVPDEFERTIVESLKDRRRGHPRCRLHHHRRAPVPDTVHSGIGGLHRGERGQGPERPDRQPQGRGPRRADGADTERGHPGNRGGRPRGRDGRPFGPGPSLGRQGLGLPMVLEYGSNQHRRNTHQRSDSGHVHRAHVERGNRVLLLRRQRGHRGSHQGLRRCRDRGVHGDRKRSIRNFFQRASRSVPGCPSP